MCSNRIEIDRVEIIEINDRISVTKLLIRSSSMMMMMMIRSLVMIIQVLSKICVCNKRLMLFRRYPITPYNNSTLNKLFSRVRYLFCACVCEFCWIFFHFISSFDCVARMYCHVEQQLTITNCEKSE